jgi:hypothetical protein
VLLDNIRIHLKNPNSSQLFGKEKELFDQLDFTDNQLRIYPDYKTVVNILMEKYAIRRTLAYKLIQLTQTLFGSICRLDKDYWRHFMIKQIFDVIEMARNEKPPNIKAINAASAVVFTVSAIPNVPPRALLIPPATAITPIIPNIAINNGLPNLLKLLVSIVNPPSGPAAFILMNAPIILYEPV